MKFLALLTLSLLLTNSHISAEDLTRAKLLNVSFDPTRELYSAYNKLFEKHYLDDKKIAITVRQSHGGSGKQARSVIEGLRADVVTLALAYDIDQISEKSGLIAQNWQSRLPNNSCPYYSTIVFLVRAGNPKNIRDWTDLERSDLSVITPNPKTSGGARWNYLAAYGFALKKYNDDQKAFEFVKKIYKNVPVLDNAARAATTTFARRKLGDVLITWENEAHLAIKELKDEHFEIITPSLSILAETPVALVEKNTEKNKTSVYAKDYLEFLYSDQAQEIIAHNFLRPSSPEVFAKFSDKFKNLDLFSINEVFNGWENAYTEHFKDGAKFDRIFQ